MVFHESRKSPVLPLERSDRGEQKVVKRTEKVNLDDAKLTFPKGFELWLFMKVGKVTLYHSKD